METAEFVTVTPEIARKWLELNHENRPLKRTAIARYAQSLKDGEWLVTGEAIKFDEDGNMIDGQNRLHAIIETGIPAQTLVVRGLKKRAQLFMDGGVRRSPGDALAMKGYRSNPNSLASAVRLLCAYRRGGDFNITSQASFLTSEQIVTVVADNPGIVKSLSLVTTAPLDQPLSRIFARSDAAFLHFIFSEIDHAAANDFFSALAFGIDLSIDSPILLLRNRLLDDRIAKARLSRVEKLALCIKAWNKFRASASTKTLRWRNGGDSPEQFPVAA